MQINNKTTILNIIRLYGPISRTKLSQYISISLPAISKYVSELIEEQLIKEIGSKESNSGRKATLLDINKNYGYVISIDFGQDIFRIAAITIKNEIIIKETMSSKKLGRSNEGIQIIDQIIMKMKSRLNDYGQFLGIGIAVSGIINNSNKKLILMPNLEGWEDIDFISYFEKKYKVPVFLAESARMMALYESIIPEEGRLSNLIFVSIGAGIGAGIIVFGKQLIGANGGAGELGHIIVVEGGLPCGCGNNGCLEQYASITSIVNHAKENIRNGSRSLILHYANNDIDAIDSFCIEKALKSHDKLAYMIIIKAGKYLGIAISQLINLLNPELIVIGGGGIKISPIFFEEITRSARINSLSPSIQNTHITISKNEDSGLLGAAVYVSDTIFGLNKINETRLF